MKRTVHWPRRSRARPRDVSARYWKVVLEQVDEVKGVLIGTRRRGWFGNREVLFMCTKNKGEHRKGDLMHLMVATKIEPRKI